jgi:hypothetical protein
MAQQYPSDRRAGTWTSGYTLEAMTLQLDISSDEVALLQEQARASGQDLHAYATHLLRAAARRAGAVHRLDAILAPARARFQASGLTEEQASDRYESEKHAAREANRGRAFDE